MLNEKERIRIHETVYSNSYRRSGCIGPEIVSKAVADDLIFDTARCVVIGDKKVMENAIKITNTNLKLHIIQDVNEGIYKRLFKPNRLK